MCTTLFYVLLEYRISISGAVILEIVVIILCWKNEQFFMILSIKCSFIVFPDCFQKTFDLGVCELCNLTLFIMPTFILKGKNKATTSKICCRLNTLGVHSYRFSKITDDVRNR